MTTPPPGPRCSPTSPAAPRDDGGGQQARGRPDAGVPVSRRQVLRGAVAASSAAAARGLVVVAASSRVLGSSAPAAAGSTGGAGEGGGGSVSEPSIIPRSFWGADLPPKGQLEVEQPGDVRFLLVHHTADRSSYGEDEVVGMLRSIYGFHTAPEKGWPDVAYNFFIDRYGRIWEGRAGSIGRPVKADATGGSQGFAQLASYLGNMDEEPPTAAAEQAFTALLAWLADTYDIDPSGEATFTSRGSNLHPEGSQVTTPAITGHNTMSQTVCPGRHGDELVVRLRSGVPVAIAAASAGPAPSAPQPDEASAAAGGDPAVGPGTDAAPPAAPPGGQTAPPLEGVPDAGPSAPASTSPATAVPSDARPVTAGGSVGTADPDRRPLIAVATGLLAVVGGALGLSRRPSGAGDWPDRWTDQA